MKYWIGARGRNRTGTPFRARDFKSLVSTNFTTRATGKRESLKQWQRKNKPHILTLCERFYRTLLEVVAAYHPEQVSPWQPGYKKAYG